MFDMTKRLQPKLGSGYHLGLLFLTMAFVHPLQAAERLRLATTTSTENSGLMAVLTPAFEQRYAAQVDVIATGTGKALRLAENGDVDIVLVHAPPAEEEFVQAGFGVDRKPVMHNDFVLVGPASDPANLREADNAVEALRRIAETKHTFISRGDDSGTHKKEQATWRRAQTDPGGNWYLSIGQSMGAALQIASDKRAYTLSDRGTYLALRDNIALVVVFQGDPSLANPYHIIAVNPQRHKHVNYPMAQRYIEFITGSEGQQLIAEFRAHGQQLFYPHSDNSINAGPD